MCPTSQAISENINIFVFQKTTQKCPGVVGTIPDLLERNSNSFLQNQYIKNRIIILLSYPLKGAVTSMSE